MSSNDPQVPWSEEQWATVKQTVQKEAVRARVAASFLPLVGPLSPDTDFVKDGGLTYEPTKEDQAKLPPPVSVDWQNMVVNDKGVIVLATLQVRVSLRGAQVADPELTSALELFRRAANVLARLEDAIVFRGQSKEGGGPNGGVDGLPAIWKVTGGSKRNGLLQWASEGVLQKRLLEISGGQELVRIIASKIGDLEGAGHYGPFAVVLGKTLFSDAQEATGNLVLPSDRIIPFLGGGPLLRSSTLPDDEGIIVALGAAPFELVIGTDVSVGFLQVTTDPAYIFRVYEKIVVRAKEAGAIALLKRKPNGGNGVPTPNGDQPKAKSGSPGK